MTQNTSDRKLHDRAYGGGGGGGGRAARFIVQYIGGCKVQGIVYGGLQAS